MNLLGRRGAGLCQRCWTPRRMGQHGLGVCPLEPRTEWANSVVLGKDKRYDFTTRHVQPGTEIRTQGQWRQFLKRHKLTDDLSAKELASMDGSKQRQERQQRLHSQLVPIFTRALQEVHR